MNAISTIPSEPRIFQAFLLALSQASTTDLCFSTMPRHQQAAASALFFLCDVASPLGVEQFVTVRLGRLLQQLNRQIDRPFITYSGQVRGPIQWQRTIKSRHTGEYNPTRYVCRDMRRLYDTPENQLLKYLVEQIHACLSAIPTILRMGACYFLEVADGEPPGPNWNWRQPVPTATLLIAMENALMAIRHHPHYREIPLPQSITDEQFHRAASCRQRDYVHAAALYRRYAEFHLADVRAPSFLDSGRRILLLPAAIDRDGWAWMRFQAAILTGNLVDNRCVDQEGMA